MGSGTSARITASAVAGVLVAALVTAAPAGAAAAHPAQTGRRVPITKLGTVRLSRLPKATPLTRAEARTYRRMSELVNRRIPGRASARPAAGPAAGSQPTSAPNPRTWPVTTANRGFHGWRGLGAAASGRVNGFDLEPPDQGLCVGNGYVLETVNLAMTVYGQAGGPPPGFPTQLPPLSLNSFFGQDPATTFLSDPKCVYDPVNQVWAMSLLEINVDNSGSSQLLAVSQTSDPTGAWNVYAIDSTDASAPAAAQCPCFGDQPLLGFDAHGIYVTTNEFSITGTAFNGAVVYAISDVGLAGALGPGQGAPPVPVVYAWGGATSPLFADSAGDLAYSLQPAVAPAGGGSGSLGGTEWFVSAADFMCGGGIQTFDNRIFLWAITNTSALDLGAGAPATDVPTLTGTPRTLTTEGYGCPVPATQMSGAAPLGAFFAAQPGATTNGVSQIQTNDDRMNQVLFSRGVLWTGLNTAVGPPGAYRTGVAWFAVRPQVSGSPTSPTVSGSLAGQGYVTIANGSVWFPSIGVSPVTGRAVVAFDMSGDSMFPSVGYAPITLRNTRGAVHEAWVGQLPEDGFTCYNNGQAPFNNTPCRWGDYTAATTLPDGTVWFAGEYIPRAIYRDFFANWGTMVGHVVP